MAEMVLYVRSAITKFPFDDISDGKVNSGSVIHLFFDGFTQTVIPEKLGF